MPLVDTRGFNFGPGVTAEAQQFTQLLGQGQQVQTRELALGQQRGQLDRAAQIRQLLGQAGQAAPQTEQQQQLSAQTAGLGGPQALAEQPRAEIPLEDLKELAKQISPEQSEKIFKSLGIDSASQREEMSRFASRLQSLPEEQIKSEISARAQKLQSEGRDPAQTLQLLDMTPEQRDQALIGVQLAALETKERFGVQAAGVKAAAGPSKPAELLTFEALIKDFTPEEKKAARRVKTGIKSRSVGSALQTIAKEGTVQKIAKTKSMIEGAVVEAKIIAKEQGETFTSLKQAQAALPGLNSVVDKLRELAPIATSTLGGKLFDAAVKETGFGSTKGATARAKFIAVVNNQVLPLLKPTFGAAFTVPEGDALRATMGDPDASPEQKMAQLDAFIAQKMRDIEAKEAQLKPQTEQVQATETVTPEATRTIIKFNRQGQRIE